MRVYGVAGTECGATTNMVNECVELKAGDRLVFFPPVYGLDGQTVDDPFRVDLSGVCPNWRPASIWRRTGRFPRGVVAARITTAPTRAVRGSTPNRDPKGQACISA